MACSCSLDVESSVDFDAMEGSTESATVSDWCEQSVNLVTRIDFAQERDGDFDLRVAINQTCLGGSVDLHLNGTLDGAKPRGRERDLGAVDDEAPNRVLDLSVEPVDAPRNVAKTAT